MNWHTTSIKFIVSKTLPLTEKMITAPVYLNEFENKNEKDDYILKMTRNLIVLYMFNDELDKALQLLIEIEPRTRIKVFENYANDETIINTKNLLIREQRLYTAHKSFFGFN